ncbi:hypothetical protein [Actinacidiphila glaucinigra]|uniref:hypothetical protein n=1 Tax=Actinacidiphila glaucinigra TaxID=235986 RepID=UPI0035D691AC
MIDPHGQVTFSDLPPSAGARIPFELGDVAAPPALAATHQINGRERHLLTDTLRLLRAVLATAASTIDRDAARILLPATKWYFRRLVRVCHHGGRRPPHRRTTRHLGVVLGIVCPSGETQGFQVVPRRWVVEIRQAQ